MNKLLAKCKKQTNMRSVHRTKDKDGSNNKRVQVC